MKQSVPNLEIKRIYRGVFLVVSAESCPRTRKGMTLTCGPHAAVEGRESEAERAGLPVGLGKEKEKGRCGLKMCRGKRKGFPFS